MRKSHLSDGTPFIGITVEHFVKKLDFAKHLAEHSRQKLNYNSMKLGRTRQCRKCPWRKDVDPNDIPQGYCEVKHQRLAETISTPGSLDYSGKVMACHESPVGKEQHCIGWLYNQMGEGNNIGLRIQMRHCENLKDIRIVGEQHHKFEDTLPINQ